MSKITILETEVNTVIQLDGIDLHEGSGKYTRAALADLAESFATRLGYELEYFDYTGEEG